MKTKWNILIVLALLAVLAGGIVSPAKAQGTYAVAVIGTEGDVQNVEAALGAPDGVYAMIGGAGGAIKLDIGGTDGILTIHHSSTSPSCKVGLFMNNVEGILGSTVPGANTSVFSIPPYPYDYVVVRCDASKKTVFQLDAVQIEPVVVASGYAAWAVSALDSGDVQNTGAAVGAPDGKYAVIGEAGGKIGLALGAPTPGFMTLSIYHSSTSPSCGVALMPSSGGQESPVGATVFGSDVSTVLVFPDTQYITIQCAPQGKKAASFQLDAIYVGPGPGPTGYAVAALYLSGVQNAGAAVGAPDGNYAALDPRSGGELVLDMGGLIQGNLTIFHTPKSPACAVTLLNLNNPGPTYTTTPGADRSVFAISWDFQYIVIDCGAADKKSVFELDAVQVEPIVTP